MRFRRSRLTGALSTFLLICGLACSGQQQQEDGLEVSGQEQAAENQAGANEESAENADQGDDGGGNGNEVSNNQESLDEEEGGAEEDGTAEVTNNTENDLQNIIQEMNGQQASGEAATGGEAPADATALAPDAEGAPAADAAPVAEAAPAAALSPTTAAATAAPAPAATVEPMMAAAGSNPIPFQPGGSPAGVGLPELGSKMAYIVQKGDTLGKISTKIYGSPARWNEIAKLSGMQNPNRIFAGDVVYYTLDESAVAFATGYEKAQRSEEQVKPGDTLATIAQRVYGTTTAWRSIWRQNDRIDNPDIVPPGTTIFYLNEAQLSAAVKQAKLQLAKIKNSKNHKTKLANVKIENKSNKTEKLTVVTKKSDNELLSIGNGIQIATIKLTDSVSWYINATAAMA